MAFKLPAKPSELPKTEYVTITVEVKGKTKWLMGDGHTLKNEPKWAGMWTDKYGFELAMKVKKQLGGKYTVNAWRVVCQPVSIEGAGGAQADVD